jgi:hypothetical protein
MPYTITPSVDIRWTTNGDDPATHGEPCAAAASIIVEYLGQFTCVPDPGAAVPASMTLTITHAAGMDQPSDPNF